MPKDPHSKPMDVVAEGGEVLLDGPEGLAESFTPDAARKSAERLREAARDAESDAEDRD
ncbi:hypothetical protein [Sphingomonas sp. PAMC 26621]|uniref:hypothetical protein n=1 Tax=Sphingomonas sp. PAMC 26621 TaxID=1112213 RepID=UPI0002E2D465|nr:hypothetical protein [Sphingomonas sp. PAMC 26621]